MKKIIITGGSGFLGTFITRELLARSDYHIVSMDIVPPQVKDPQVSLVKKNLLEPFDVSAMTGEDRANLTEPYAVIHLSGKSIFGRFTEEHKKLIYNTRVIGTRNLLELWKDTQFRPQRCVSASAVGWYGNQPGKELTESSNRYNTQFLSDVVEAWEHEVLKAKELGITTAAIRNGHIIGAGGILAAVAGNFRFGVGSVLGDGSLHFPWVDIRDLTRLYITMLDVDTLPERINGVSGSLHTYRDFAHAIAAIKKSLIMLPLPQWLLALRFGDFASEMLVDQRVVSEKFGILDFIPEHTDLHDSVQHYLR